MQQGLFFVGFVSVAYQKCMAADSDDFIAETPWNHFARKNIGYLYAIQHGPRGINFRFR
jgi:hypothetical protein